MFQSITSEPYYFDLELREQVMAETFWQESKEEKKKEPGLHCLLQGQVHSPVI